MKKAVPYALILTAMLLAVFLCGFYLGRNVGGQSVQISVLPAQSPSSAASETAQQEQTASDGKININTASAAMLQTLPGIGEVLAQRIVDYRQANGPFSSLGELLNVEGFGEKKLAGILDYATVGG